MEGSSESIAYSEASSTGDLIKIYMMISALEKVVMTTYVPNAGQKKWEQY